MPSTFISHILQEAYILATGTSASASTLATFEAMVAGDGGYGRIAAIIDAEMGARAQAQGVVATFQGLMQNGLGVTYTQAQAQAALQTLAAQGIQTWSGVFAHYITLNAGDALALDNRANAANAFNDSLATQGKSALFGTSVVTSAVRNLLSNTDATAASYTNALSAFDSLAQRVSDQGLRSTAIDGYVAGATAFVDLNGNGRLDPDEASTTTDSNGNFLVPLNAGTGRVVVTGGIDLLTRKPFEGTLTGVSGSALVTPITTMIEALVSSGRAATVDDAAQSVRSALNLPATINVLSYDPLAVLASTTATAEQRDTAIAVQRVSLQVATVIAQTSSAIDAAANRGTTGGTVNSDLTVINALAAAVQSAANSGTTVDLTSRTTVTSVVVQAAQTIPGADVVVQNAASIADVTTTSNRAAAAATTVTNLAHVAVVAGGDAVEALVSAAAGTTTFNDATTSFTGTNFVAATEHAVVGDVVPGTSTSSADQNGGGGGAPPPPTPQPTSAPAPAPAPAPVNSPASGSPTVDGAATQNQVLTAVTSGIADGNGLGSFEYQWLRDGATINGATASSYMLGEANVGHKISVRVSYTDGDGFREVLTSSETAAVANVNDAPQGTVTAAGTPTKGQTLTASAAITDADGVGTFAYQWLRNGADIPSATATSYTLASADVGTAVSVRVSYTDGHGTHESVISAATATVASPPNTAPTGTATAQLAAGTEDTPYTINPADLLAGFSDADGDVLTITNLAANHGQVTANPNGTFTFTPVADANGTVTLTYMVADGHGGTAAGQQTFNLAAVNDAPTGSATATLAGGTEDTAYTINVGDLLVGFTDPDADVLTVLSLSATHGTLTSNANGSYTFVPAADYNGPVSLAYTVSDGHGGTAAGSQSFNLAAVNDAPSAPATGSVTTTEDTASQPVAIGAADVDGDTLTYTLKTGAQPQHGTVAFGSGTFTYTPAANANGADAFTIVVGDGHGGSVEQAVSVTISAVNDAPTGSVQLTGTPTKGQTLQADASSVADVDGLGTFGYQWLRDGTPIASATGAAYTLVAADVGTKISVKVSYTDGGGTPEAVTSAQTAAVASFNSPPAGTASATLAAGTEDTAYTINASDLLAGFSDPDGDTLSLAGVSANHGVLTDNGNGTYTFVPVVDYNGAVTLSYTVQDGHGGSVAGSLGFTLAAVNDAPTGAVTVSGSPTNGQTLQANAAGVADADGLGAFAYQWLRDGNPIATAMNAAYTLAAADVGTKISVRVGYTDGGGTSESVTSLQTATVVSGVLGAATVTAGGDAYVNAGEATSAAALAVTPASGTNVSSVTVSGLKAADSSPQQVSATFDAASGKYRFDATQFKEGTLNVAVGVSDAVGNTATNTVALTLDTSSAAPTIAAVAADDQVNSAEKAAGVTVTGTAEANSSVAVTWGTTTLTATADGSGNWSRAFTSAQVPGDGSSTVSAIATDPAGNTSSAGTRSVSVDTVAPTVSIGSVAIDDRINDTEDNSSVTISGTSSGADGQAVAVKINGASAQTATVATGGAWSISYTSAQIQALGEGTLSVTADLSDAAGNAATQATHSVVYDRTAPNAPVVSAVAADDIVNTGEKAAGVTVSGTAEAGAAMSVTWGSTTKTATATGGNWSVSFGSGEIPGDGNTTISATATDAAGNTSTAGTRSVTVSTGGPSISIGTVAGDDRINDTEDNSSVTISGTSTNADGQTVTVKINGANSQTATVASGGAWSASYTGAQVQALSEGSLSITADVSDAAGNAATQAARSVTYDRTAPSAPVISTVSSDDMVNASEKTAGVTVSGAAESGAAMSVTWGSTTKTAMATGGNWSASFGSAEVPSDGSTTISATATDVAGNTSTAGTRSVTVDTTAPTVSISTVASDDRINDNEDNSSVTISGTSSGADGQTVTVKINGANAQTATVATGGAWSVTYTSAQVQALSEGSLSITADLNDAAGNAATQATRSVTYDRTAPNAPVISTVASDDIVNASEKTAGVSISGTAESGAAMSVTWGSTTKTATATGGNWSVSFASGEIPGDGSTSISATATDAAGNASSAGTRSVTVSTGGPSISIGTVAGDDRINDTEDNSSVTISGTSTNADGQTVTVKINGGNAQTTTVGTGGAWSVTYTSAQVQVLSEGNLSITADVSDAAGNAATQATKSVSYDRRAPSVPVITTVSSDDMVNASEKAAGVTVSGTAESGAAMSVTWGSTTKTTTATGGNWSVSFGNTEVPNDGSTTVSATATDAAGNASTAGTRAVTVSTGGPTVAISTVAGDDRINDTEDNSSVTISGTSTNADGQTVTVKINGANSQTATVASGGAWSVSYTSAQIQALSEGALSVTADVSDSAGNAATQAVKSVAYDRAPPSAPVIGTVSSDDKVNASEKTAGVTVSGTAESGAAMSVTWGSTTKTATATGGNWSVSFASNEVPSDGSTTISATATDAAGNASTAGTRSVTVDTTAPTVSISTVASDDRINNAEDDSTVTVSGISTGADGQTVTVKINGANAQTATVATGGAWSVSYTSGQIQALSEGTLSLTADVNDAAGNAATQASRAVTYDRTAPSAPVISSVAGDDIVNASEKTAGVTVSGTAESGASMSVTWGSTTKTATATGSNWSVSFGSGEIPGDGSTTISATATDTAGNTSSAGTRGVTVSTGGPAIAIGTVAGDDRINDTEDNSGVTISGTSSGADGQTLTVKINGANAQTATIGTGGAWSVSYSSTQIQALSEGTLSVTADVSDSAGNPATQAVKSVSYDRTAPSVPVISTVSSDDKVNASEKAAGVTVSGTAESGAAMSMTWGSTTKTATATGGNWSVSFGSGEIPSDGSTTISATATDVAGNTSTAGTRSVTVDTTAPTVAISTVASDDRINNAEDDSTVTVSGTSTGADGQTVTVKINGANAQTATVASGGAWSVSYTSAQIQALSEGSLSLTADVSDAAGNAATQATKSVVYDRTAPSAPVISTVAGDDIVNATEKTAGVTVSGTAESGAAMAVTWGSTTKAATATGGAWSVSFGSGEIPGDGSTTISATATDAAGNASTAGTRVVTVSTGGPTVAIGTVAGDDRVNDTEDNSSVTVSGTSTNADGQTVTVKINGGNTQTATVASGGAWSVSYTSAQIQALSEGTLSVTADVSDSAGNAATQATKSVSYDRTAPSAPVISTVSTDNIVNASEKTAGVTVSGTAETGAAMSVSWGGTTKTATATGGNWSVSFGSGEIPSDGSTTISATATDVAGNTSSAGTRSVTIDTTAPTVTIGTVAGDDRINDTEDNSSVTIGGTSTNADGQTVTVKINGGSTQTATVASGGAWSVSYTSAQIQALSEGTLSVTADVSDAAGNPATQATKSVAYDRTAPSAPVVSTVSSDDKVNASEKTAGVTVSGTAEAGAAMSVTWGSTTKTATATGGAWSVSFASGEIPGDGSTTISATATDAAGNTSSAGTRSVTVDTIAPTVSISTVASDDRINDTEDNSSVTIGGTSSGADGQTVTVKINGANAQTGTVATGGAWSVSYTSSQIQALSEGTLSLTADVSDAAGNAATQATKSVSYDRTAPSAPVISTVAGDDIVNASEKTAGVTVSGTAESGAAMSVTWGSTTKTATATGGNWSVSFGTGEIPGDGSTTISATATDAAGNTSSAGTHGVTVSTGGPAIAISTVAGDDRINDTEDNSSVTVSGTSTNADGQTVTVKINGANAQTATVASGGAWSVSYTSAQIQALSEGTLSVTADVSDSAGNPATQAVKSVAYDRTAPSVPVISTVSSDDKVNASEKTAGVTVSGTAESGAAMSVTWGSTTKSAAATSGNWSVSFGSTEIPSDGSTSISATATDVAGNTSSAATRSVTVDTIAPTVSISTAASDDRINNAEDDSTVTVSGTSTGADGQTLTVKINGGNAKTATVATGGAWSVSYTSAEVQALSEGTLSLTADVSDAAGNAATQATKSVIYDRTAPSAPVISTVASDDIVNATEKTAGVTVSGTAESGAAMSVTWGSTTKTATATGGNWSVSFATGEIPGDGSTTISATATDAAGNTSSAGTRAVTVATSGPSIALGTVAGDDRINDTEDNSSLTISGTSTNADGQTVTVKINGGNSQTATVASGGAWSVSYTSAQIQALSEGTLSVTADVSDSAGNAATQAVKSVSYDHTAPNAPVISTVASDNIVNASEKTAGVTVSGTAESGAAMSVTWGSTTKTTTATGGNWSVSFNSAEVPSDGSTTISATATDAAGNASTAGTRSVTVDTTAPTVSISTVASDDRINDTEDNSSVTVSGTSSGADGQTVTVKINGANSQTATVASGGAWSVSYTSAQIQALSEGSLSVTADVNDAAGNAATQAVKSVTYDRTAPSAPVISTVAGDDIVNASEKTAGVTVSGTAESGASMSVTWGSTTKTATATGGNWSVSFASGEIPSDGSTTISATATDAAGNASSAGMRGVTVSTGGPAIAIGTVAGDDRINDTEDNSSVTVSGTSSGADGQTVTVKINGGNTQTATVASGGAWSVSYTSAQIQALSEGTLSVTADVSDAAGNPATQATKSVAYDRTAPSAPVIGTVSSDDKVNASEKTTGVTVSGTAESGAAMSVTWGSTTKTTTATGGNWSVSFASGEIPSDGSTTISATATDAAGNASTAGTRSVTVDTTAPTVSISTVASDDRINDTEDNSSVTIGGTSSGADGQTVTVKINGANAQTATVASGGAWSVTYTSGQIQALSEGTLGVTADVSDAAGNAATQATKSVVYDRTAPSAPVIATVAGDDTVNASEKAAGVTVSGTAESGAAMSVTWGSTTKTTTASGGNWRVSFGNTEIPNDGSTTVSATATDAAGNASTAGTRAVTVSTGGPTIAIGTVAGDDRINDTEDNSSVTIGGTSTNADGQTVTVKINGGNSQTATVASGGAWSVTYTSGQIQALSEGTLSVTADVSDAAGNAATQAAKSVTYDRTAPSAPVISAVATDNIVNASEKTAGVTVSGTAESGAAMSVTWGSTTKTATATGGNWSVSFGSGEIPSDGSTTIGATATDAAGNASTAGTRSVTVDTTAPTVSISTVASDDRINNAEDDSTVTVSGTSAGADGQTVTVKINGANAQTATVASGGAWSVSYTSAQIQALSEGTLSLTADVSDAAGNAATQATKSVSYDRTAPSAPVIGTVSSDDKVNASEKTAGVTVSGTAESGAAMSVTWGSTTKTATATGGNWSVSFASGEIPSDGSTTISATASDAAGNTSSAGTRSVTIDTTAPTVTIGTVAGDDRINDTEDNSSVTVSGTSSGADGQTVTVKINGGNAQTATVASGGAWSVSYSTAQIQALSEGTLTVTADVSDAAGNAATQDSRSVSYDRTAPNAPVIGTVAADDIVNASEKTAGVTVSGTAESGAAMSVTWGSTTKTATAAGGNWSVSFGNTEIPADGSTTISATATDAAGNTGTVGTRGVTIDTTAPTIAIGTVAGDDRINDTEDNSSVTVSGTSSGADGQTVTVKINGANAKTATVATGGAWSLSYTSTEIQGLSEGSLAVTADVSDAAGNPATQATRTVTYDRTAPSAPSIGAVSTDDLVSASEKTAGVTVSGTAEAGASMSVTWGSTTKTATATGGTWSVSFASGEIPSDGSTTVSATATDAAGNTSSAGTRSVTVDTIAPTLAISTVAGDDRINGTEDDSSVTVSGTSSGADGQTVTVKINGANAATGTVATGGAWSVTYTSAQIQALSEGTLSITADVSDAAGNAATQATKSVSYDRTAPTSPTIASVGGGDSIVSGQSGDATVVGTSEASATITVKTGATTLGTTTADASGNWTYSLTAANITTLGQGASKSVTASATDAAGNTGTDSAAFTFTVMTVAPATPAITSVGGGDSIVSGQSGDATVAGTADASVTITLKSGATTLGTTTSDSSGNWSYTLTAGNLTTLGQGGSKSVTATASDAVGNTSSASSGFGFSVDTVAPSAPSFALGTGVSGGATATEATQAGGVATLTAESGSSVSVTFSRSGGGTVTKTLAGTGASQAVVLTSGDLTTLGDGTISVSATATDSAGNASSAGTTSFTLDTSAPSAPGLALGTGVLGGATAAEATQAGGVVTVTGENGSSVSVTFSRSGGGTVTKTLTGTGSAQAVTLISGDLTTLGDGTISVSATATDSAGNTSSAGTTSFTLDTSAPSAPTLALGTGVSGGATSSEATQGSGVVTVSAESGSSVSVTFSRSGGGTVTKTLTGTGSAQAVTLASGDLTTLGDGTISVSATATDAAGNASSAGTTSFTLDTVAPTTTIATAAFSADTGTSSSDFITKTAAQTISGTTSANLVAGEIVEVSIDNGSTWSTATTSTGSNTWSISKTLTGSSTLQVRVSDTAGNSGTAFSQAYTLDTTAPATTIATAAFGADTGTSSSDFITKTAAQTISGTTSANLVAGEIVEVSIDNGSTWSTATSSTGSNTWSISKTLTGSSTLQVRVSDTAGNSSTALSQAYTLDTTPPTTTIATAAFSADTGTSSSDFITKTAAQTISGTTSANLVAGEIVEVSIDNGSTWSTATSSTGSNTWSISKTLTGSSTLQVRVSDAAGNSSTAFSQAYTLDTTAPTTTIATAAFSADTGTSSSDFITKTAAQTISGTTSANLVAGEIVEVSIDNGSTWSTATSSTGSNTWSISKTLTGSSTLQVRVSDAAGNSGTAFSQAYTLDTTAPTTTIATAAFSADTGTSSSDFITKTAAQTVSGTTSANLVAGEIVEVSIDNGSTWSTATSSTGSNTWSISKTLTGSSTLQVRVSDTAGNSSTALSQAYTLDTTAPSAPTLALGTGVSGGATSAEATQAGGVVTLTAESGSSVSVTFSRSGGGTVTKSVTGTGSSQAVTLATGDLTTLGNGTINVSATATDTAGNTSSAGTTSFTLDTVAPSAPTLALGTGVSGGATSTEATQAGGVVTLTAESGSSVSVTFSRSGGGTVTKTLTGTGSSQAVTLASGDLTTLGDGSISVSATATDSAGNASSAATTSFTLDTAAPTISAFSVASAAALSITSSETGSADLYNGSTALGLTTSLTASAAATMNVSAQSSVTTASLIVSDSAGNTATSATPVILGTTAAATLTGTSSAEFIFGFAGNDTITGGAGADVLSGGGGTNTYNYAASGATASTTASIASNKVTVAIPSSGMDEIIHTSGAVDSIQLTGTFTAITTAATFLANGSSGTITGTYVTTGFDAYVFSNAGSYYLAYETAAGTNSAPGAMEIVQLVGFNTAFTKFAVSAAGLVTFS